MQVRVAGSVAALAVLVLFTSLAPFLYGSMVVLVVAYVLHFLPAGLQSLEPALQQVTEYQWRGLLAARRDRSCAV
ncbi:MAG: hypothetical protein U0361_17935 [Nitrospiraceae bacterium]